MALRSRCQPGGEKTTKNTERGHERERETARMQGLQLSIVVVHLPKTFNVFTLIPLKDRITPHVKPYSRQLEEMIAKEARRDGLDGVMHDDVCLWCFCF